MQASLVLSQVQGLRRLQLQWCPVGSKTEDDSSMGSITEGVSACTIDGASWFQTCMLALHATMQAWRAVGVLNRKSFTTTTVSNSRSALPCAPRVSECRGSGCEDELNGYLAEGERKRSLAHAAVISE